MSHRKTFLIPFALVGLAGCVATGPGKYPSLAVRDVERVQGTFEPVASNRLDVPPVEVDSGTSLESRLTALLAQAQAAHAVFTAAAPAAELKVSAAGNAEIGSDSWAVAQVALADLDSARSEVAVALGDLDILHASRTVQAEDSTAIDAARDQVIALVGVEDATLARLRGSVR